MACLTAESAVVVLSAAVTRMTRYYMCAVLLYSRSISAPLFLFLPVLSAASTSTI